MKGMILCGGTGSRLQPSTLVTNKHLLPVYDKPMVYYPIDTLVSGGINDIIVVTGAEHAGDFIELLGDGDRFNCNFTYKVQEKAGGIAHALGLCKDFAGDEPIAVILGDNIFQSNIKEDVRDYGEDHSQAKIFITKVEDPKRFGVPTLEDGLITKITEKPEEPESEYAVTGLYFYNSAVWNAIKLQKPSGRGELEITDVNNWYINNVGLGYKKLEGFWSDAGTHESLYQASKFIKESKLF